MMTSELVNIFVASAGITFLFMFTSFYYWLKGRKAGVTETIALFYEHDPECVKRLDKTIRENFNVDV